MSSSKKRSVLTSKKYRSLKSRRIPIHDSLLAESPSQDRSVSLVESVAAISSSNCTVSSYSNQLYSIVPCSKGIDMDIIRCALFDPTFFKSNTASIISKASQCSFVDFVDHSSKTTHLRAAKSVGKSINPNKSERYTQSTISSFISPSKTANSLLDHISNGATSSLLSDKSRCVVEDFMLLPKNKEVILLVPKCSKSRSSIIRDLDRFRVTQFGTKRTTKYHVIKGLVKSNIHLYSLLHDDISISQIKYAFKTGRDNGYGLTIQICNSNTCTNEESYNSNVSESILIKWIDVLNGRLTGLQVWSKLEKNRDFSTILNKYCSINDKSDSHQSILNYIHEDIWCDRYAMIYLLAKYYMTMNKKRRDYMKKDNGTAGELLGLQYKPQISDFNATAINSLIESTFLKSIKECYTDFTSIHSPILSQNDIYKLVEAYKSDIPEHYLIMKHMFGFNKKENW